ncbi:MAG: hypothetical protein J5662_06215, partial [Clostridia bacterium]|nr:hypothetical protein [Clostridia bacterium]
MTEDEDADKVDFYSNQFSGKFLHSYMCYYTSANVVGDKKMRTGVLQLTQGRTENEYNAIGVFALQKDDE